MNSNFRSGLVRAGSCALALSALLFAGALAFPLSAFAAPKIETISGIAQAGDFVLEPGKIEVSGNPGDVIERSISITNRVGADVKFKVQTEDFVGSNDANQTITLLGDEKSPYSFKDSLIPEVAQFSLKFGERITIPVKIAIPTDAQPGGYYASVLISNAPDKEGDTLQSSGAKVISRLGALFFVRVNGPVNESGKLEDFKLGGPSKLFYQHGPFDFDVLFNNTGSVYLVPYGVIDIANFSGRQVAELPVNAYFALPASLRYRTVSWDPQNLIGRYTATIHLNRGYASTTDDMTISFWILPWKLVLEILVPILLLAGIVYIISLRFEFKRRQ